MHHYIERTLDVVAAHVDRGCFNFINQVMAEFPMINRCSIVMPTNIYNTILRTKWYRQEARTCVSFCPTGKQGESTHTNIKNENVELISKREVQKWLTKYIDGKEATQMYCTKCMLKRGSLIIWFKEHVSGIHLREYKLLRNKRDHSK